MSFLIGLSPYWFVYLVGWLLYADIARSQDSKREQQQIHITRFQVRQDQFRPQLLPLTSHLAMGKFLHLSKSQCFYL